LDEIDNVDITVQEDIRMTMTRKSWEFLSFNNFADIKPPLDSEKRKVMEEGLVATNFDYPLLRPIEETNPAFPEYLPWNLTDSMV
jgi:hypothetical protein